MDRLTNGLWLAAKVWAILVGFAIVALLGLQLSGVRFNAVATQSMAPTFPADTLALTKPVDVDSLAVGDVITFTNTQDEVVMHRVVDIIDHVGVRRFRTQGDANRTPDVQLVHENAVVGQMVGSVPALGGLARSTQSPSALFVLALLQAPIVALAWRGRTSRRTHERPSSSVVPCPAWLT